MRALMASRHPDERRSRWWSLPLATRPQGARTPSEVRRRLPAPSRPGLRATRLGLATVLLATAAAIPLLLWAAAAPVQATPGQTTTTITLTGPVKVQVDALTAKADAVRAEIDALDTELEQQTEAYNQLQVALEDINVQMGDLRRELQAAEADHAYRQRAFEERIRAVYKAGGRDQLLQLLLLSDGVDDLYNRVRLVASLADQDQRLVENLKRSTDKIDSLLAEMDQKKRVELNLRRKVEERAAEIDVLLAERQAIVAGLDSKIAEIIEKERIRQEEEQRRLREAMAALLNGGQVYHGPLPQTDDAILNQVVETAAAYLGIPYVWGGSLPSTGMDCSGFTRWVYAQHGVRLPHYSRYQSEMGIPVDRADIQPGDLVAFGFPVHHVGIYIGDDLFIHAPRTGDVIKISRLSSRSNLAAIRRFPLESRTGPPLVR